MSRQNYNKVKAECPPVYAGGKAVGHVKGDVFYKSIHGSKHILKRPPSIAISCDALNQAETAGALKIVITDQETGTQYHCTIAHLRRAGFELDRGFGQQLALPLDGWIRTSKGEGLLSQLPMFSDGA